MIALALFLAVSPTAFRLEKGATWTENWTYLWVPVTDELSRQELAYQDEIRVLVAGAKEVTIERRRRLTRFLLDGEAIPLPSAPSKPMVGTEVWSMEAPVKGGFETEDPIQQRFAALFVPAWPGPNEVRMRSPQSPELHRRWEGATLRFEEKPGMKGWIRYEYAPDGPVARLEARAQKAPMPGGDPDRYHLTVKMTRQGL